VPLQRFTPRLTVVRCWHPDRLSIKLIVLPAILPILAKSSAHSKPVIRCDRYIAPIEQSMDVRAQEETIVDAMLAIRGYR
jgi:hypothetical protein